MRQVSRIWKGLSDAEKEIYAKEINHDEENMGSKIINIVDEPNLSPRISNSQVCQLFFSIKLLRILQEKK